MEVFTYHLMWVAAITYSAELAPEGNQLLESFVYYLTMLITGLRATMIGCVGSLHYGSKLYYTYYVYYTNND